MNKSFLSVSPSEGNGNAQVVINVKENMSLDDCLLYTSLVTKNLGKPIMGFIFSNLGGLVTGGFTNFSIPKSI